MRLQLPEQIWSPRHKECQHSDAPGDSKPSDFRVLKALGSGVAGIVYLAHHVPTGTLMAVKAMRKVVRVRLNTVKNDAADTAKQNISSIDTSTSINFVPGVFPTPPPSAEAGNPIPDNEEYQSQNIKKKAKKSKTKHRNRLHLEAVDELNILKTIHSKSNSRNITALAYAFTTKFHLYLAMSWCPGGELWSLLEKEKLFNENQARFYVAEILLALQQLHSQGILYRDLKLENILIDYEGHVVLADFGLSKLTPASSRLRANSFLGTPHYIAPEMYRRVEYDEGVDWWSLGVVTYFMLAGSLPFDNPGGNSLEDIIKSRRPHYPFQFSAVARNFIDRLLEKNPTKRAKFENIRSHNFFKSVVWHKVHDMTPPFKPNVEIFKSLSNIPPDAETVETRVETDLPPLRGTLDLDLHTSFLDFTYPEFSNE